MALTVGVAALFFAPRDAEARGRHRAVPDLRAGWSDAAEPEAGHALQIPVVIHIATTEGFDVTSTKRIGHWVTRANEVLGPHGIEVYVQSVRRLPAGFTDVRKSKQRRQLASFTAHDGAVHLFVIESLDLVHPRLSRRRVRGLHWRYRGINRDLWRREYVVVTREAPDTTLAHEVGHLLGLRHATADNNIMCSCRTGDRLGFTYDQGAEMRVGAVAFANRQQRARRVRRRWADRRRRSRR